MAKPKLPTLAAPAAMHNVASLIRERFPETPIPKLIESLQALQANEARIVPISETVPAYPPEGLVAFSRALKRVFGWFDNPNTTILSVEVGVGEVVRVPSGSFTIPGFAGMLRTEIKWSRGLPNFHLAGEVRQRDLPKVQAIMAAVREELASGSIYKGKAIRYNMPVVEDESEREHMSMEDFCPKFLPLDTSLSKASMVFPVDTNESIEDLVFAPVENTDLLRRVGVQLRGGVILYGPPGCGKTLIASVLANLCVAHGWTYVEVSDVLQLPDAYRFGAERGPCVLFLEDMDRAMHKDEEVVTAIRNTMDGVDTKRAEVRVVLTSNFAEKLPPALLRSGRMGHHIYIGPPDAKAAERLLRLYAGDSLEPGESLGKAGAVLAGRVPATLRDVVERAKVRAVRLGHWTDENQTLLGSDIEAAAHTCVAEFDALQPVPPDTRHPVERGLDNLAAAIGALGPDEDDEDEYYQPRKARKADDVDDDEEVLWELTDYESAYADRVAKVEDTGEDR